MKKLALLFSLLIFTLSITGQVSTIDQDSIDYYLEKAEDAYKRLGNSEEASMIYEKILQTNPGNVDANMGLIHIAWDSDNVEEVDKLFDRWINVNPNDSVPYSYASIVYAYMDELEKSFEALDKFRKLYPEKAKSWEGAGQMLMYMEDYERAYEYLNKAIELNPESPEANAFLGYSLAKLGNFDEAIYYTNKAIELSPDWEGLIYQRAAIYSLKGDKIKAMDILRHAIEKDSKYIVEAKNDPDFEKYYNDEVFIQLTSVNEYQITFQVDMSDFKVDDSSTVTLRIFRQPLQKNWFPMEGPDDNGIYKITVPFHSLECGDLVEYKYWLSKSLKENEKYGDNSNRFFTFCCQDQILPIDKWNELNEFTYESKLTDALWDNLSMWIYLIGNAKERDQSMQEIAQEFVDFWGWTPPEYKDPDYFMWIYKFKQAKSEFGYFELITHNPEKVEFIQNKDWEIMLYDWNEEGVVNGVSAEEMTEVIKHMRSLYVGMLGWTFEWQDIENNKAKITITK